MTTDRLAAQDVDRLKAYIRTECASNNLRWRVDDPTAQYDPLVRLSAIFGRIDDWAAGVTAAKPAGLDVERLIDMARMATLTADDAPFAQDVAWNKGWVAAVDAIRQAAAIAREYGAAQPAPDAPYGWDNPAPGTSLWRLRNHPDTMQQEDWERLARAYAAQPAPDAPNDNWPGNVVRHVVVGSNCWTWCGCVRAALGEI